MTMVFYYNNRNPRTFTLILRLHFKKKKKDLKAITKWKRYLKSSSQFQYTAKSGKLSVNEDIQIGTNSA